MGGHGGEGSAHTTLWRRQMWLLSEGDIGAQRALSWGRMRHFGNGVAQTLGHGRGCNETLKQKADGGAGWQGRQFF